MKPPAFTYHRVDTVAEAVHQLYQLGSDAKLLAGGQSLAPMMNLRLARPAHLIDVNRVRDLAYIEVAEGDLRIGALTRHRQIERHPGHLGEFSVLQRSARWVGHYPIRSRGTFGGSIAHADPAAEWCVLALLHNAEIVAEGPRGRRSIRAEDFFQGFLTTALDDDEMVVEVRFWAPFRYAALAEFARRQGDFAIVVAAVGFDIHDGSLHDVRIALGGVADRPLRFFEAERSLEGQPARTQSFGSAAQMVASSIAPYGDLHGSTEYRRFLTDGLVNRAFADALEAGR